MISSHMEVLIDISEEMHENSLCVIWKSVYVLDIGGQQKWEDQKSIWFVVDICNNQSHGGHCRLDSGRWGG